MEMDTLITLGTGIAAIAVIVTVIRGLRDDMRANNNELRDELRSDNTELRADIRELRGLLISHIADHSHAHGGERRDASATSAD